MDELLSDLGVNGLISLEDKDRSKDSPCLIDVISCFTSFLLKAKPSQDLIMQFLRCFDESILLSEQSQAIRHAGLLLFSKVLLHIKDSPESVDVLSHVFLSHCFGERDPRNLMLLFRLSCDFIRASSSQYEELFESIFCYFPISFTPPPEDPFGITPGDLSAELEAVLTACFSNSLSSLVLEALVERLEDGNNACHGVLIALSHLLCDAERWGLVSSDCSIVARLVEILMKYLGSNPKEVISIFLSAPWLLLEAKNALSLLARSIFLENGNDSTVAEDDSIVLAMFELDAVDDEILDKIVIDPLSPTFRSFLSCISDKLPADALKSFCKRLDGHLKFTGDLQNLPFISAAVQALQRLQYHFYDSQKISNIQAVAFEALIRQTGNSKVVLRTLIETRLLSKLSPSLYSYMLSIQSLSSFLPSDAAKDPILNDLNSLKEDFKFGRSGCCNGNPASSCDRVPSIPQSQDTCEWLRFLALDAAPIGDELLLRLLKHPCVWVRLALIQRITNDRHIDNLLSDPKRVVRKAAAVRRISLACNNTRCCKS
ncbi:hypothetical protein DI09_1p70 [Mitosporidium daphniae]|uniref:MMS19 nucleotide excision repair protein n=1 Tax=Mitosporidium daphniae TaxID=1485682 RepID=A0A098VQN8_9MICR|nr:uncharacterized protein DI09_91p70 [Mitosporidium daphniae]XP_013238652.1 uncharacterized protein DI09_1p70 [Mitosporidium daphniae]KGG50046.1 hypothetical protein DI09_91p70 [Mitosporidium daphniae]KGG52157.1 hypothetical protein DI09_1p70 [Mitosporidium daphniae]|eukprot:XP_013236482.1 uncharacterized protein DI09_91p70 [Mitosporidium daphniae]